MMNKPFFTIQTEKEDNNYARFAIEPLPQGFGNTIGNSLRRVLLTYLSGTAVSKIKIEGVKHQFSTIEGLREDIVDFTLNLKNISFRLEGDSEAKLTLAKSGPGEIHASDIKLPAGVSVANPETYLGSLANRNARIEATIWIEQGTGYMPSEERKINEIGVIPVDSLYTPIRRVHYTVEE